MDQITQTVVKSVKRKSERLGWKKHSERDRRPLSERMGEGYRIYADTGKSPLVLVP